MPLVTSLNWIRISVFCSFNAVSQLPSKRGYGIAERGGTFPSFEDEGDAIPSFVFDVKRYGCESGTSAIFGDCIVLQVAWFTSISNILSNNHVFRINWWNRPQHTDLPLGQLLPNNCMSVDARGGGPFHHEYPLR